jgi:PTS system fructose-specific IIC component
MAAEAIEEKGKEMGIPIKVETNGSGGAKNVLTKEEIAACDGIIIAADKNVEMARFDGKPLIKTKVQDGIHKSQELIEKIVNGEAPVYHHTGEVAADEGGDESFGHSLYKHLMNGVSHMLPFVIGGGILIALAFLFDDYSIDPSNFGMNTPLAAVLKTAGGVAFGFMLPILSGYIAMSIADRPGLMPGFVGGSIAAAGTSFASITAPFSGLEPNAVSGGFLGALFAGFVAGYLVLFLKRITEKMPPAMDGLRPMLIYPVGGLFLISMVMFAVNPFFAWLNTLLANALGSLGGANAIVLGAVVGGMMSIDMGGPFNKASYVFGTAALATATEDSPQGFMIMAAVMAGGMVPPIAIAISSWLFKNKFTDNDRANAPVNAIMGLCFISEAAIPYAAADPGRVIPSCVIGSAVAGALSMAFGCTLRAPHGGIFVIPTIGNPVMYLVALLVGSVVGAVVLGFIKKPAKA